MMRRTYAEPFCVGVEALGSEMEARPTVLAGDVNGNANAAAKRSEPHSFTKGAEMLQELGIRSARWRTSRRTRHRRSRSRARVSARRQPYEQNRCKGE